MSYNIYYKSIIHLEVWLITWFNNLTSDLTKWADPDQGFKGKLDHHGDLNKHTLGPSYITVYLGQCDFGD